MCGAQTAISSQEVDDMADDLTAKLGELLKKKPWYELPRLPADLRLYDIRNELRAKNLHDTQHPRPALGAGSCTCRVDAAVRLRKSEQPLVGCVATLRL
jgi:hypothetical protein